MNHRAVKKNWKQFQNGSLMTVLKISLGQTIWFSASQLPKLKKEKRKKRKTDHPLDSARMDGNVDVWPQTHKKSVDSIWFGQKFNQKKGFIVIGNCWKQQRNVFLPLFQSQHFCKETFKLSEWHKHKKCSIQFSANWVKVNGSVPNSKNEIA